jgi:hypothetical protein
VKTTLIAIMESEVKRLTCRMGVLATCEEMEKNIDVDVEVE